MQRWFRLIAVSFFAAMLAATAHAQGLEKPKLTIGVGGKPLIYYLPLTIAERNGYFKQEGLDVEIPDFPGGAKALQALLGGSVDIVSGAYEHTISQQAKGNAIEALVLEGQYSGIVLALSKSKAASYKSPADLKGMKIGVTAPGSSTNMFVNILLAKAGLPPDSVSIIGVGGGAGAVAIMKRGEIDAVVAAVPPEYYTDKALYKKALEANIATFKHDGFISKEAGEHVAHDLLTFDPTMKGKTIDLAKTVDMSFQQKAV